MKETIEKLISNGNDLIINTAIALVVIIIGFKIVGLVEIILKKPKKFNKLDATVKSFIISVISITLKVMIFVIALQIMGVPMASIITVVGSFALALGLALQGGLSNIAGGVMLLIFRPFKVGDYISNGSYEGTVKSITMFYTTITTLDNKNVQLPNGSLSNTDIVNYTTNGKRRIDLTICVDYKSNINKVKTVIEQVIKKQEKVLQNENNFVRLFAHNNSSLDFAVKVWVEPTNYWEVYFDLMEQIKEALDKNKIEIPFNQLDVHIK